MILLAKEYVARHLLVSNKQIIEVWIQVSAVTLLLYFIVFTYLISNISSKISVNYLKELSCYGLHGRPTLRNPIENLWNELDRKI